MSITLEERLQRAAELLDQAAVQPSISDVRGRPSRQTHHEASPMWVRAAAVLLVLGAMGGVAWLSGRDTSDDSASSATTGAPQSTASGTTAGGASETTAAATDTTSAGSIAVETTAAAVQQPAATLPITNDLASTPVTVQGSGPTEWYRLQPDLDVAWFSDGQNQSQLCFRTPAIQQCKPDAMSTSSFVAVRGAGNQWLIVTLDAVDVVNVRFDDGTQRPVPVQPDSQIAWRVGRIEGGTPADAAMLFEVGEVRLTDTTAVAATIAGQP
jgi:hypothetical protein